MEGSGTESVWTKLWRWAKVAVVAFVILFVAGVIWRIPYVQEQDRSAKVAQEIRDSRITMADVDGSNLPPEPDPALVDAAVEGIDANGNGIRDDVELAIFKKYPGDANLKIRAAELQYAHALQFYLTSVFTSETLVAAIGQDERGSFCISKSTSGRPASDATDDVWRIFEKKRDLLIKEVEDLVFSTTERAQAREHIFATYMTSYGTDNSMPCDLSL